MPELTVHAIPTIPIDQLHESDRRLAWQRTPVWVNEDTPPEQLENAALDVFHESVPVKIPEDFSFEVWDNLHCLSGSLTPNDDTLNPELATLIDAAKKLSLNGLSKTRMYNVIRDNVTTTPYTEQLRQADIRHLEILIDVLDNVDTGDIMKKHGLQGFQRTTAISNGFRKIGKYCDLNRDDLKEYRRLKEDMSSEFTSLWRSRACLALKKAHDSS